MILKAIEREEIDGNGNEILKSAIGVAEDINYSRIKEFALALMK